MRFVVEGGEKKTIVVPFTDFSNVEVVLAGKGSEALILGYFVGKEDEHFDLDLRVHHASPRTKATTLVKGVLSGRSSCRFRGLISISKGSHLVNSFLFDDTLLLSEEARVESIPSLEIEADDVRASHGATVGRIADDQIYYLKPRGLNSSEARRLIIEGFFAPVLKNLEDPHLRRRLLGRLNNV